MKDLKTIIGVLKDNKVLDEAVIGELEEAADSLKRENDMWWNNYREAKTKAEAYEKRLKNLQHTVCMLGGIIGEIDITALTTEEKS